MNHTTDCAGGNRTKGLVCAMVSGATFGMMPLFSLPAMTCGMGTMTVVAYRFVVASVVLVAVMLLRHESLRIGWSELWRITVLAVLNLLTAVTLICGYMFMPSGAATTIQFSHPVFTCLILMLFFGERPGLPTIAAIVLAVAGVAALSWTEGEGDITFTGVALELLAGLSYAIYMILVPKLRLDGMDCTKLTFYVFLLSAVMMTVLAPVVDGVDNAIVTSPAVAVSLLLLGIIPTALSNITLTVGLRNVGSTVTSTLSALEPVVAVVIGLCVFGEPFSVFTLVGLVCIVTAVTLLVFKK